MPNKNEPLVLTYDNLVIGGNLEALLFASTIRLPLIFTWSQPPFYFEEDDHFGNLLQMWEKLYFSMSLSGMVPFGDSVHHINYVDCETLAVFTKEEKKFLIKFKKLWVFDDEHFYDLPPSEEIDRKVTVIDHFKIRGILKEEPQTIYTNQQLVSSVHFFKINPKLKNQKKKNIYVVSNISGNFAPEYLIKIRAEQLLEKDLVHVRRYHRFDQFPFYRDFDNVHFCYAKLQDMKPFYAWRKKIDDQKYLKIKMYGK